jgi:hypothetical protein
MPHQYWLGTSSEVEAEFNYPLSKKYPAPIALETLQETI